MDATKDELKAAPWMRYDHNTTTWIPDTGDSRPTAPTGFAARTGLALAFNGIRLEQFCGRTKLRAHKTVGADRHRP